MPQPTYSDDDARYYTLFTFNHRNRRVEFGPYVTQDEAKSAFQRQYGYWPEDAVKTEAYVPITNPKV